MSWSFRPFVAGIAALGLLLPASAAMADDSAPAPEPDNLASVLADLPVPVSDVTDTDTNLHSTRNEVSVLVTAADGSADVVKLRTQIQVTLIAIDTLRVQAACRYANRGIENFSETKLFRIAPDASSSGVGPEVQP